MTLTRLLLIGFCLLALVMLSGLLVPDSRVPLVLSPLLCGGLGWFAIRRVRAAQLYTTFLEGTLDAVPQPLTVTDPEHATGCSSTKRPSEAPEKTREQVNGRHCSEWQAHICNTDKCGITSLRSGRPRTNYMQDMGDGTFRGMQVDTSYIVDKSGTRLGHVEIVTDIHTQNQLGDLHSKLAASLEEVPGTMSEIDSSDEKAMRPMQPMRANWRMRPARRSTAKWTRSGV